MNLMIVTCYQLALYRKSNGQLNILTVVYVFLTFVIQKKNNVFDTIN